MFLILCSTQNQFKTRVAYKPKINLEVLEGSMECINHSIFCPVQILINIMRKRISVAQDWHVVLLEFLQLILGV